LPWRQRASPSATLDERGGQTRGGREGRQGVFVMLDFDAEGNVVEIEDIGQQEFSIRELLE
jgi:hypothetical protein